MNILKKVKFNYLTLFIIVSSFFCGMFNYLFILFIIIIIHELGHIIMIKLFGYEIINIEILPFGGKVNIKKNINSSINKEIIISISGIVMQSMFYIFINYLYIKGYVNTNYFLIFKNYNIAILLFNVLPIYPLDGYFFLKSLLEKITSFYLSINISIIISFISFLLFLVCNYKFHYDNYLICVFLFYKLLNYIKESKSIFNLFLLERYLYDFNFKKKNLVKGINYKKMKKDYKHYFLDNKKIYKEKDVLKKLFDNT